MQGEYKVNWAVGNALTSGPSLRSYLHFTLQRFGACSTKSSDVIKSDTFSYAFIIDNYVYNSTKGTESIQEEE